ncbi:hypothetical protein O7626_40135 [Micromonospora sp. WMMD1102]|uniref:hypothetical protein n=1 Tax=Micromonospora sp. WMMD1102 TaxID=3016105 RepID=UPI0024154890|nr:hypothetical protein [Micromonospora sp. WMMD1102]MDG4792027.1 hypothetical protein [Micromonospora sp. WMMD1102]
MQQAQCIRTDHGDIDSTATHKARKPGWQRPHAVCTFHAEFLTGQGWIVEEIEPYAEDVTDLFTGAVTTYQVGKAA